MNRWPLLHLPHELVLDGTHYRKTVARPGVVAEYEEVRGSRRVFVLSRGTELVYNYDERRGQHVSLRL